ncbi:hypothetical protein [Pseudomonas sp. QTF5]|uniref:hypothetical protein n=1 Tax=Pseudomonas sp. QTF5 TaxID=1435425 RepID=UPI0004BE27DA|nr:hypothetical protein [Pseudomonas sp. QTF5]
MTQEHDECSCVVVLPKHCHTMLKTLSEKPLKKFAKNTKVKENRGFEGSLESAKKSAILEAS